MFIAKVFHHIHIMVRQIILDDICLRPEWRYWNLVFFLNTVKNVIDCGTKFHDNWWRFPQFILGIYSFIVSLSFTRWLIVDIFVLWMHLRIMIKKLNITHVGGNILSWLNTFIRRILQSWRATLKACTINRSVKVYTKILGSFLLERWQ